MASGDVDSPSTAGAGAGAGVSAAAPASAAAAASYGQMLFTLRRPIPPWAVILAGSLCIVFTLALWWFATRGEADQRWIGPTALPSPGDTFRSFHSLWFDRALTRNTAASLQRVVLGFALATVVGVPLGVLCGCFPWINAFFAPLSTFGRNIPVAALIPLTFSIFGIEELQKIMFIFIACVAFIITDTARAILDVGGEYIDTSYTLGASRLQVILKVLFPLALPSIFNSLRLLFGLAFGYIMLAELVVMGQDSGGLGYIISISQRRGRIEHVVLVLLIIPMVALAIDRLLYWIQKELFPYRYGGSGLLHKAWRALKHGVEDLFTAVFRRERPGPPPATTSTSGESPR